MAKKARKQSAAKRGKKSKAGKPRMAAAKKKTKKKVRSKAKRKSVGQKISSAYHAVADTFTGTGKLRNKMEPPGTSETE